MSRFPDFMRLSAALTAYEVARLTGTGVGEVYFDVLTTLVRAEIIDELLDRYCAIEAEFEGEALIGAILDVIMANAKLGPVARNILKMWYLSIWYQLPTHWRELYAVPTQTARAYEDVRFVVSKNAYIQGLVWSALGSHPQGAKQPGYGTWSTPPGGLTTIEVP